MKINYNSAGYRWYVVILLLLVFILSYFDRYILSLVVDPIKKSMGLSDFQIGLLLGPAFSLFNVAVSIPLGLLADKTNRKWLLIAGIAIWCTMTTMSGFAMTFLPLLIFRLGLGLGEAVVSPCSVSIISDYFKRDNRARAISVYMAGPYLGAGLAFLGGGVLVSELRDVGHVELLGRSFVPWQTTFLLVGLPGLLFFLLMLTVKEPPCTDRISASATDGDRMSAVAYMMKRWKGFGVLILGSTCNFAMSTLTFWNVPLFERVWGWNVLAIGAVTGGFYFTAGPIGTLLALWASKRFGRGNELGGMYTLILGLAITVPASALYPVMPTPAIAVAIMFIAFVGKSAATAGGPAALQMIVPGEIRTRSVAIFNTIITLVGPLLGPPIIGAATDWTGNPASIGYVLCGFVIAVGVPTFVVLALGFRHYRELTEDMAMRTGGSTGGAAIPASAGTALA